MEQSHWFQISMTVSSDVREAVTNFFFENGSVGCQEDENGVIAYFPSQINSDEIKNRMHAFLDGLAKCGFEIPMNAFELSFVQDKDWNAEWKKNFKPIDVSEKFVIKPTWEPFNKDTAKHIINIDPKQAFGTGTHATTQIMLKLLERHVQPGITVLDAGTGTGILSIAAAMLGATVTAFDNDPIAVEAAAENISLNACQSAVDVLCGELRDLHLSQRFDVILANINKNVIISYLPEFYQLLRTPGFIILSGILEEEGKAVEDAVGKYFEWQILNQMQQGEWLGFVIKQEAVS